MQRLWSKDLLAGLLFVALGLGGFFVSLSYRVGTASEAGPGFFPLILSVSLFVLGMIQIVIAMREHMPDLVDPVVWRVLLLPTVGIVLFGLLLDRLGLVISLAILLCLGMLAGSETRVKEMPFILVAAIAFSLAVFIYGVGLPMKVWP